MMRLNPDIQTSIYYIQKNFKNETVNIFLFCILKNLNRKHKIIIASTFDLIFASLNKFC
jgi:hypothetical protein